MTRGRVRHTVRGLTVSTVRACRQVIAQEREDLAAAKISGEQPRSNPPKGTMNSIPGCTSDGIVYSLECMECRRKGIKRTYIGESSRSPYQRGKEHLKEVREGVLDHPMVQHFWEEKEGEKEEEPNPIG